MVGYWFKCLLKFRVHDIRMVCSNKIIDNNIYQEEEQHQFERQKEGKEKKTGGFTVEGKETYMLNQPCDRKLEGPL
jgi:hypothetical protein